jgi:hypothetical protein
MIGMKAISRLLAHPTEVKLKLKIKAKTGEEAQPLHDKVKKAVSSFDAPETRGKARNAQVYEA